MRYARLATIGMCLYAAVARCDPPPTLSLYLHLSWSKSDAALRRIIPAAKNLGYQALVLEIGGNVELAAQGGASAGWSQAEVRALLDLARGHGLEVIPCASLLSHPECGPHEPKYVDPALGLKLWEPGVYEFLDRYVSEVCDLFGKPRYFHARLDEARETIAENSRRLGVAPDKLLADHISRLDEIVRRQGARLIVYHDMLLPAEQVAIGTALGGEPLNCWKAVEAIPRDVIVNFWLYDFLPWHAPAVEFFTNRGFEVWVSPWLAPEPLCKWAAEKNLPVVQTTWCDPTGLAVYEANLRGVVLGAAYRLDPTLPSHTQLAFDPHLRGVRLLSAPPPTISGDVIQLPVPTPDEAAARADLPELPSSVDFGGRRFELHPLLLRKPRETLDGRLTTAKLPLRIIRSDGTEHVISGVNRGRGEAEVILYTPAFGRHTGTNMFGGEAIIAEGVVQDRAGDPWGTIGYMIPPGGCVISGHCAGDVPQFMGSFKMWEAVRIVDADGRDVLPPAADDGTLLEGIRVPVTSDKPVREVWLLHATMEEMGARRVGQVSLVTAEGMERAVSVEFRRELASWQVARWLLDRQGRPAENVWLAWSEDHGYANARCLWATRLPLEEPVRASALRIRPTPAGAGAGWMIVAVAVGP